MKDCRRFIKLQEAYARLERTAVEQGYPAAAGQLALNAPPPREQLTGLCTFHYYYDSEGKRRSAHALKDRRRFIDLQEAYARLERTAVEQGYPAAPGQSALNAPPPPPGAPPAPAANPNAGAIAPYERPRGQLNMVHRVALESSPPEHLHDSEGARHQSEVEADFSTGLPRHYRTSSNPRIPQLVRARHRFP